MVFGGLDLREPAVLVVVVSRGVAPGLFLSQQAPSFVVGKEDLLSQSVLHRCQQVVAGVGEESLPEFGVGHA